MKKLLIALSVLMLLLGACDKADNKTAASAPKEGVKMIKEGSAVKAHYTLTVEGATVDSSAGREPLAFTIGGGQLIAGFEKNVIGLKAGDKKSFTVQPADGYGEMNPEAIQEIPKSQLPPDIKPEPGMTLYAQGPGGQPIELTVAKVTDTTFVVDLNHPLAGKVLNFDVEIMDVQ